MLSLVLPRAIEQRTFIKNGENMEEKKDFKDNLSNNMLPSFYTVIPSYVRYCKELSFFEIVLYSEIVARTNHYGFCWTTNATFSSLYNCSERTITRAIANLIKQDFICIKIFDYEGKKIRHIYIKHKMKSKDRKEEVLTILDNLKNSKMF